MKINFLGAAREVTGYQAQGTLGRRLVDGAKRVRLFDEDIPVPKQGMSVEWSASDDNF